MSGTPEKILEHFLETIRLEPALNEATGMHIEQLCVPTKNNSDLLSVCVDKALLEGGYVH
jgi:hypothetical protein